MRKKEKHKVNDSINGMESKDSKGKKSAECITRGSFKG